MADAVATEVPSHELCDFVANLTEDGLELVRRLVAFVGDYHLATSQFDVELESLDQDDERYKSAASTSGLPVLHAMVEQMSNALMIALGISDEDLAEPAAA